MVVCDKMLRVIKSEFYKVISVKLIIITFLILLTGIGLYSMIFEVVPESEWRTNAEEMRELQEEGISSLENSDDDEDYNKIISKCGEVITTIDYCMEHNIPYNLSSVYFFLFKLIALYPGLIILCLCINGKGYIIEGENGTWKNVLTSGIKREKIVGGKIIFSLLVMLGIFLLYILTGILVGVIRFGLNGNHLEYVQMVNGSIIIRNYIKVFLGETLVSLYKCMLLTVFMYLLLVYLTIDRIAIIIPSVVLLFSNKVNSLICMHEWSEYLPFYCISMTTDEITTNMQTLFLFIGENVAYLVIMLYFIVFRIRKDRFLY